MTIAHLGDEAAQAYVDDALAGPERAACEAHVAACADCRLLVESYRALGDALEGLDAPAPPPDFTLRVMDRIDALEHARAVERWLAGGILAAAIAAAALLAAVAGADTWARVTAAVVTGLTGLGQAIAIAGDVTSPVFRALRLQIAVACCLAAIPLLLSFWRLLPRTRPLAVRP